MIFSLAKTGCYTRQIRFLLREENLRYAGFARYFLLHQNLANIDLYTCVFHSLRQIQRILKTGGMCSSETESSLHPIKLAIQVSH